MNDLEKSHEIYRKSKLAAQKYFDAPKYEVSFEYIDTLLFKAKLLDLMPEIVLRREIYSKGFVMGCDAILYDDTYKSKQELFVLLWRVCDFMIYFANICDFDDTANIK